MTQWTISRRISSGGAVLLLLFVLVGVVATLSFLRLRKNAWTMKYDALPGVVAINGIMNSMSRAQVDAVMALEAKTQTECSALLQQIAKESEKVHAAIGEYELSINQEEDRQNFAKLKEIRAKYIEVRKEYTDLLTGGRIDDAAICMREKVAPAFKVYDTQLALMTKWNIDYGDAKANDSYDSSQKALWTIVILEVVSVVLAVVIVLLVLRGINRRLSELAKVLGDASAQVSGASQQVAGASQTLAEGASKQAAALEESSAAVEELSGMAKRNSQSADEARTLALEAKELTNQGAQQMSSLVQAMEGIRTSSDKIAKVVKTIDEISFQTNILALNAAVEAARAGEAGAGFAVVADEVRSLAQRAALASRETATMIEESLRTTGLGSTLTQEVAASLGKIEEKAARVGDLVSEIANASGEQAQGLEQVTRGVSEMDQITQQNASNAEETASAAEELSAQSISMKEHVDGLQSLIGGKLAAS